MERKVKENKKNKFKINKLFLYTIINSFNSFAIKIINFNYI